MMNVTDMPRYLCQHTAAFAIDGNIDKAPWSDIAPVWLLPADGTPVDPFWEDPRVAMVLAAGDPSDAPDMRWMPYQPTAFRACWTDTCLVLAFRCIDRDIWSTFTQRDEFLCAEEVVEAFLSPDGDLTRYCEFQISPRNVIFDALIHNPDLHRATMTIDTSWNCEGLETAVCICGTLERRTDVDLWWSAEIAIPFASLRRGRKPLSGDVWRCNFYRIDAGPPQEFTAWSPTNETPPNFHVPARFGQIVFE
jgi:hypothetical protein